MTLRTRLAGATAILGLGWSLIVPAKVQAIPAFSRQIHADCRTCHFQGMGALNAFGRAFEMNNFRLTKNMRQELLEQENREREKRKGESHKKGR